MSKPSGIPKLPSSVGGHAIPDFLNCEVCEDWEVPALGEVPEKWDFSIKKSPIYGKESGVKFDQGAVWYPLREVKFGLSDAGLGHYQAHYPGRTTVAVGGLSSTKSAGLKLNNEEHIVGFRAYSNNNVIEGVRVWTNDGNHKDFGKVQGPTARGSDPNAFFVPKDHEVVNFFGHTNDNGQVHGLGVSYIRRLESLRSANAPVQEMKQISSLAFMDAATQQQWSNNNMAPIIEKRKKAAEEVAPIYQNINANDYKAWVKVRHPPTGAIYYVSTTETATCWIYVPEEETTYNDDETKNSIVSIGSYSAQTNTLGISGYIMNSLPATLAAASIGLAFTYFMKPLIQAGIEWGIKYAATKLAQYAAQAGVEAFALYIPNAVASIGGLVIAGALGVLISFGVLLLMNEIWKKYWLVLNVYNFDADHDWSNLDHHSDNSKVSNGEWMTKALPKFVKAGSEFTPPGFEPLEPLDSVVTYLSMTFENDSTIFQGLGEGVVMGRADNQAGICLKYVVHRFKDNEIGLKGVEGDPSKINVTDYYNEQDWVTATSIESPFKDYKLTGYTSELSGNDDGLYTYEVNLGLPPPVTSNPRS